MRYALAVLAFSLLGTPAHAQRVMHRVRFGETCASISQHYYGSKAYAPLLRMANAIAENATLKAGEYVRVPTAWVHTVRKSTTLSALAAQFLGDARRSTALAMFNDQPRGRRKRLPPGTRIIVPFTLTHAATQHDTFSELSQRFYGTAKYAGLIASYNFINAAQPPPGVQLEIPFGDVRIAPARLEELVNAQLLGINPESERDLLEGLREANALLRRGEYWNVPLQLLQALAREHPADNQIAEMFKQLAVAYVAVQRDELAVRAFAEALSRAPRMSLDVVGTSPKVMRVFVEAKTRTSKAEP